jgi:hypothetical protein
MSRDGGRPGSVVRYSATATATETETALFVGLHTISAATAGDLGGLTHAKLPCSRVRTKKVRIDCGLEKGQAESVSSELQ